MRPRDLAALVVLAALWGGSFLFIRVASPALGPLPLVGSRVVLAALVLAAGTRALGRRAELRPHARKLLVLGAVNAAVPFALIAAAELRLTASFAAMLNGTQALWGALFGVLWLGERVTARRAAGLLLGIAGVGVLVGWSPVAMTRGTALGVAAMLVATCSYALGGTYAKRALVGVPAPTLALGQQAAAAAWLVLPALWRLPHAHPTGPAVLALLALALLSTSVAYVLYFHLIAAVGPTTTNTVTYLIPVFGTLWGRLFLGEPLSAGMLAGLACILGSVPLVHDARARRAVAAEAGGRGAATTRAAVS